MKFAEKLKKAMQELNLNQRQVVTMTGKSKGSVSQYLSGKQIPSEDVQSAIATSLGLASDYFTGMDKELQVMPQLEIRDGVIPRLDVTKAAKLMGMNHNTVRKGLQQGVFPWGYAVHTSDNRWSYFINAKRFAEVVLPFPALSPSGYLLHIFYTIPHKSWKLEQVQFCPFPGSVLVFSVFLYHPLI